MKQPNYVLLVTLWLLFSVTARGQNGKQGGVVVHSDPRLSLLVKKPHNMDVSASASVVSRRKTAANLPEKSAGVADTKVKGKPGKTPAGSAVVVASSATNSKTKPAAAKVNSAEASSTGRKGGWTPPVIRKARSVASGKGFRVQIYNGPDRRKAIDRKTEFMRSYPGVRTYLTYIAPCFRVKVGDYRNRTDAIGMLKEMSSVYTPCMIVPDVINISTY